MSMTNEQIQALKARYSEPETPNCRICGAKMSIQRAGGGSLVYGCDGRVEGDGYAFKEGRDFADKHYEQSRETVYNMGDADVMALLAERDVDKALIAESVVLFETLRQRIAELEREKDAVTAAALAMRDDMREARTLTVKFPEAATVGGQGYRKKAIWVLQEACFDAGITLDVEE